MQSLCESAYIRKKIKQFFADFLQNKKIKQMKNTILIISALFINALLFGQTIPNGDFELGTDSLTLEDWHTINELANGPGFTRTTDSYFGNYAVKLYTFDFGGNIPGVATLGNIGMGYVSGGIHFPYKPEKLTGVYKHPTPSDSSLIWIYFLKVCKASVDTIGQGSFTPAGSVDSYTDFEININYTSSDTPDSMNIVLLSDQNKLGSTFYIDKLKFEYEASYINNKTESYDISIYPNPSKGIFYVNNIFEPVKIEIYDIMGKTIYISVISEINNSINLSSEPRGIYFIKAVTKKGIIIKKINIL